MEDVRHRQTNNTADEWRASLAALDRALAHYRDLGDRRGETKAQLEMSRDPRWRSPYYWAGFTLQGDWR